MRAEPLHKLQGAALLPHLPGYSGAHVDAAPGSWWEQLLDLDGAGTRQKGQRLDLDGAGTRQKGQRLDLDGAQSQEQMFDLDGARKEMRDLDGTRKEVLDLDGARKERPALRDEDPDHASGHSVHAEL